MFLTVAIPRPVAIGPFNGGAVFAVQTGPPDDVDASAQLFPSPGDGAVVILED